MLSRQKVGLLVFIGINLIAVAAMYFGILPTVDENVRNQTTELRCLTAVQFLDSVDQLEDGGVEVTGLQTVCDQIRKDGPRYRTDYVLVDADNLEESFGNCLLVRRRERNDTSLVDDLAKDKFAQQMKRDQFNDLDEESQNYLEENFPDVDFDETPLVWCSEFSPAWIGWIIKGAMGWSIICSLYLVSLLFKKPKEQPWQGAINDDRSDTYRQHPKAMRLIGSQAWSNGSLRERAIDSEFDVAEGKAVKYRKPKQAINGILVLAVYIGGTVFTKRLIHESQWLANFDSFWLELAMILPLAIGYAVISGMAKSRAVGFGEEQISIEKASYRKSEFHQFHDRVLNELEFTEVGDFRQISSPLVLTRTIYLSRNGNVLVEVGTQSGIPFFTVESLTNGGKFLETHSMVSRHTELLNESKIHQRRSADHQDIVKAFESHDELVSEFTFAGSAHEAKFTPENFGRFLAYPSLKKLA